MYSFALRQEIKHLKYDLNKWNSKNETPWQINDGDTFFKKPTIRAEYSKTETKKPTNALARALYILHWSKGVFRKAILNHKLLIING